MLGLEIVTSRIGRLWTNWKPLIDSLVRKGAKEDPRKKYPDLKRSLDQLIEEQNGRFFPKPSPLSKYDDDAITLLVVRRGDRGKEHIRFFVNCHPTNCEGVDVDFDYFGTIGNSKYEAQTGKNRQKIHADAAGILAIVNKRRTLCLSFRLSTGRRDRDLDNLADALMPTFPDVDRIILIKLPPTASQTETLTIATEDCISKACCSRSEECREEQKSGVVVPRSPTHSRISRSSIELRKPRFDYEMFDETAKRLASPFDIKGIIIESEKIFPEIQGKTRDSASATINYHTINVRSRAHFPGDFARKDDWNEKPQFVRVGRGLYRQLSEEERDIFHRAWKSGEKPLREPEYTEDQWSDICKRYKM